MSSMDLRILQPETRGRSEGWDTSSFLSLVQYCPVGTQEAEEPGPWGGGWGQWSGLSGRLAGAEQADSAGTA